MGCLQKRSFRGGGVTFWIFMTLIPEGLGSNVFLYTGVIEISLGGRNWIFKNSKKKGQNPKIGLKFRSNSHKFVNIHRSVVLVYFETFFGFIIIFPPSFFGAAKKLSFFAYIAVSAINSWIIHIDGIFTDTIRIIVAQN